MLNLRGWLNWKTWTAALVAATGAFWVVVLSGPPKTIAAAPPAAFSPMALPIPANLPVAEVGNAI
jgi:hypothetical protein